MVFNNVNHYNYCVKCKRQHRKPSVTQFKTPKCVTCGKKWEFIWSRHFHSKTVKGSYHPVCTCYYQ